MFVLQKVEMRWKDCRDPKEIEEFLVTEGIGETEAKVNPFNHSLVSAEITRILPSEVSMKFSQLQNALRGICHTIKFYFLAEESGKLPIDDLEEVGFVKSDSFIWRYNHPDYSVAAIAIPNVRKDPYWVLQVSNIVKGKGLPITACDMAKIIQKQLQLELPIEDEKVS